MGALTTRATAILVIGLSLFVVCCTPHVDRKRWQTMAPPEKVMYIRTLMGREKVFERKGGRQRQHSRSPEAYVQLIDTAYVSGASADPEQIFDSATDATTGRGTTRVAPSRR